MQLGQIEHRTPEVRENGSASWEHEVYENASEVSWKTNGRLQGSHGKSNGSVSWLVLLNPLKLSEFNELLQYREWFPPSVVFYGTSPHLLNVGFGFNMLYALWGDY